MKKKNMSSESASSMHARVSVFPNSFLPLMHFQHSLKSQMILLSPRS
jgi:hypothetical protein